MQRFLFGKHQPDQEDLDTNYSVAVNVLPRLRGYGPFPSFSTISSALTETPLGIPFTARTEANTYKFYVGTATKLWTYNAATHGWTDVSRVAGGGYSASTLAPWYFDQYGSKLIAVNIADAPQVIDVDTGSNFANLAGSPPQASYVKTVGDFLVLGALAGDLNKIQWSSLNDIEEWVAGTNSGDFQLFPDGGPVTAITGSDAGYVFQQNAVRRMIFVPGGEPDYVFRFEKVENYHGAISPLAVVPVGPHVFYLAQDGFYRIGPDGVVNIGFESVNDHFLTLSGQTNFRSVMGCSDPLHPRIYWAARTAESAVDWFNRIMVFDYATQQWSEAEIELYQMMPAAVAGVTLEGLDVISASIDALDVSLDSQLWAGGAPVLAGIDQFKQFGFFQGGNMEARISTAKLDIAPGRRSLIRKVRPLTDAPLPAISVDTLGFPSADPPVVSNETTPEADGMCSQRASGRYHRFNLRIPSGISWTYALGVEVDSVAEGTR